MSIVDFIKGMIGMGMGMGKRMARQVLTLVMVLTMLVSMVPMPGANQVTEVQAAPAGAGSAAFADAAVQRACSLPVRQHVAAPAIPGT